MQRILHKTRPDVNCQRASDLHFVQYRIWLILNKKIIMIPDVTILQDWQLVTPPNSKEP